MYLKTVLALIVLGLTQLDVTPATASIIYTIVDHPALQQNPSNQTVHISGTITTNGTISADIPPQAVITAFDITVSSGVDHATLMGGSGQLTGLGIATTPTEITLPPAGGGSLLIGPIFNNLLWQPDHYHSTLNLPDLQWDTATTDFGPPLLLPIASSQAVPEPASLTLALLGLGALATVDFFRRHRQPR